MWGTIIAAGAELIGQKKKAEAQKEAIKAAQGPSWTQDGENGFALIAIGSVVLIIIVIVVVMAVKGKKK